MILHSTGKRSERYGSLIFLYVNVREQSFLLNGRPGPPGEPGTQGCGPKGKRGNYGQSGQILLKIFTNFKKNFLLEPSR